MAAELQAQLPARDAEVCRWELASLWRTIALDELLPGHAAWAGWEMSTTFLVPSVFEPEVRALAVLRARTGPLLWLKLTDEVLAHWGLAQPTRPALLQACCERWAEPLLASLRQWLGDESLFLSFIDSAALKGERLSKLTARMRLRDNHACYIVACLDTVLAERLAEWLKPRVQPEWSPPLRLLLVRRLRLPVSALRALAQGDVLTHGQVVAGRPTHKVAPDSSELMLCAQAHRAPHALLPLAMVNPAQGMVTAVGGPDMSPAAGHAVASAALVWADVIVGALHLGAQECRQLARAQVVPGWKGAGWLSAPVLQVAGRCVASLMPAPAALGTGWLVTSLLTPSRPAANAG